MPATTGTKAAGYVLPASSFPSGWTSVQTDESGNCLGIEHAVLATTPDEASISYQDGNVAAFNETVGVYSSSAAATTGLQAIEKHIAGCASFSNDGHTVTVKPTSFPTLGEQSTAYRATVSAGGQTVGADIIVARKGSVLVVGGYETLGAPKQASVQEYMDKALARTP